MFDKKFTATDVDKRISKLKGDRGVWETHWQDIGDYILPRKNQITKISTPGEKKTILLLDNTGVHANELLAGALHGLLTNPNGEWFELTTGDQDLDQVDVVRRWLQDLTTLCHNVLNNSNFQTEVHEFYLDLCGFGTALMYMEEDDKSEVRFSTDYVVNYFIEENSHGVVDRIYREWKWPADKIVEEFGIDSVGKQVKQAYEKRDCDRKFRVVHAVYPKHLAGDLTEGRFKYISQYFVMEEEKVELRIKGFRDFPYIVARWSKASGEIYGRSPGMTALPDVKVLNKMTETMLIGAQKVVDPPLQLPDDGYILPIKTGPGGLNYYRAGTNEYIRPVFNDTRIDFGFQAMEERRTRVRDAYYVNQLQLREGPQMTATEVMQRTEEQMRLLGPMLGRQQSEFLRPLIDRLVDILFASGKIDKNTIPEELQGRKIDVRYSSLIAKSQRLNEAQNIMRTLEATLPIGNIDPSVYHNISSDGLFRVLAGIYGFPERAMRTKQEVKEIRDAQVQAQQQAQAQMQEQAQIENMAKIAPVMGG